MGVPLTLRKLWQPLGNLFLAVGAPICTLVLLLLILICLSKSAKGPAPQAAIEIARVDGTECI